MKDFNKLILFGVEYSKEALLVKANDSISDKPFEHEFWSFIQQWLNEKDYVLVESSGSTGKPKKNKISKQKMISSAQNTCKYLGLKTKEIALLCMSPKHIGGMMMIVRSFYAQLDLHIQQASADPLEDLKIIPDFIALVPYQVHKILERNASKLKAIKHIIIGGGSVNERLETKIVQHKIKAFSTFGMTETISHFALREIGKEDYYTCLPNVKIGRLDNNKLVVHAPQILEAPIKTNDLIEYIDHKKFRWLGRADFAIESGGLKVIPEILEKKLNAEIPCTFIISSLPHDDLGQIVVLLIESSTRLTLSTNIFDKLEKYEKPKQIFFLNKFDYTNSGKINRIETRKQIL